MVKVRAPRRGEIVWLNFDPQTGHQQAGRRPAIVLSDASYNSKSGLAVVCPITGQAKGYPFEVPLPPNLPVQGVVLVLGWALCRANGSKLTAVPNQTESWSVQLST